MCNTMASTEFPEWERLIGQDADSAAALPSSMTAAEEIPDGQAAAEEIPAGQADPITHAGSPFSPPPTPLTMTAEGLPLSRSASLSSVSTAVTLNTVLNEDIGAAPACVEVPPPPQPFRMQFNTAPEIDKHTHFNMPVCTRCQLQVNPLARGVRLAGKKQQEFVCPGCNSKASLMQRALGGWPTEAFTQLPMSDQTHFYRSDSKLSSLKNAYAESVVKHEAKLRITYVKGDFQPLTYWHNICYDTKRIVATTAPEDIKWNPQLGWTYRVRVVGGEDRNEDGVRREQILSKFGAHKAVKKMVRGGPYDPRPGEATSSGTLPSTASTAAPEKSDSDSSSSSSSSSSSESSSGGKKKNKKKKAAKSKQQLKEKEAKKRRREKEKAAKASKKARGLAVAATAAAKTNASQQKDQDKAD